MGVIVAASTLWFLSSLGTWMPAPVSIVPALAAEGAATTADFADIVDRVKRAVIGIRARAEIGADVPSDVPSDRFPRPRTTPRNEPDTPFGVLPDDLAPPRQDLPNQPRRERSRAATSQGSGFFIHPDGYAVTTNHVTEHSSSIDIKTDDGKTYRATVVGSDPRTDLALIKVEGGSGFPFVRMSERSPRVGEWVLAIGNPFGLGGTVTAGIISSRARDIGTGAATDFLQIDAPINQGNSGGPTFDLSGAVVGVNSAIFSPTGGSIGIGFAIPAETVRPVVAQLKDKGRMARGWLGIEVQPVSLQAAGNSGLKKVQGALVAREHADGPAAKAGIKAGDVITSLNNEPVRDARDLIRRIGVLGPGEGVTLVVSRQGEEQVVTVTLADEPRSPAASDPATTGSGRPLPR
jgi:serine protease Do